MACGANRPYAVYVSCYDYLLKNDSQEERHATYELARIFYCWAEKIYNALSNEEYALGVLALLEGLD